MQTLHCLQRMQYERRRKCIAPVAALLDRSELVGVEEVSHADKRQLDWAFTQEELSEFPALLQRNFWCVQRHQARGMNSSDVVSIYHVDGQLQPYIMIFACKWTGPQSAGLYRKVCSVSTSPEMCTSKLKCTAGISRHGIETSRLAVETTLHPISYSTYEGEPAQTCR
jgi:hypothetical protein